MDIEDVKEAIPIELAEYAVGNQIADHPEFAWLVPYTPKRRNKSISKRKTKYWRKNHKYGVSIPKNVMEEMQINNSNGNTYWKYAIYKDTNKAKVDYKPREYCTQEELRK